MTDQKPDFSNVEGRVNGVVVKPKSVVPAKPAAALAAAVIAAAMALIRPWEGEPLKSYQDIVGVWTACVGHTGPDVIPNHTYTREQCDKLLESDTGKAYAYVAKCIRQDLPVPVLASFTSLTFNVGPGGVCGSTLQKRANAKELTAACSQILRWNRAGGKIVQGLVNRRKAEYELCMTGVPK